MPRKPKKPDPRKRSDRAPGGHAWARLRQLEEARGLPTEGLVMPAEDDETKASGSAKKKSTKKKSTKKKASAKKRRSSKKSAKAAKKKARKKSKSKKARKKRAGG